jgi:anti-anti-sigma factor
VAVALGIVAVALLHLDRHGVAIVGHIDGGLPPLATPDVTAHQYLQLVPAGIGVVLVGFAEGLGAAKTYAARAHYEIDPNRELLGLGAANLGAGLSSGMVVNGSLSKTAVNGGAGANSQVSGLIVGALTLVTLVLLTGLFGKLPEATLAAVVIVAVSELVDVAALRRLYRVTTNDKRIPRLVSRPDFIGAFTALAGVLLFDTLPGLAIGVGVSFLLLLYRTSHPRISRLGEVPPATGQYTDLERHPNDVTSIGVAILRVEGGIFFANAEAVRAAIRAAATRSTRAVVLDAETISFLDVTGARMLEDVAMDLAREHVRLVIAHGVADVRRGLRVGGADGNAIELYSTVQSAVAAYT